MAKKPINEQFIKMQKLAGVITESQYNKHMSEVLGLAGMHKPIMDWDNMPEDTKIDIIAPYVEDRPPEDYIHLGLGQLPKPMADAVLDYLNSAGTENVDIDMDIDDYSGDMDLDDPYSDELYESKKDKKQKITKSQLKETIRREILAALTEDNTLTEEDEEEGEDEDEVTLDAETEDTPTDTSSDDFNVGGGGSVEEVQKDLTAALNSAKQLGDKKLVRQIGNALTYFTRQQISSEEM